MIELVKALESTSKQLDEALKGLSKVGKEYAEAEKEYRIALNKKLLELRAKDMPVTICQDLAKGDENVAILRFNRDVKDALFRSKLEAINVKKLELNILKTQYEKEWQNANNNGSL